jgi:hypothetical protein
MIDDWKIKEGDLVQVDFNLSQHTLSKEAEVLRIPCATGDSWIFRDMLTKTIYYVSEGCTITKFSHSSK